MANHPILLQLLPSPSRVLQFCPSPSPSPSLFPSSSHSHASPILGFTISPLTSSPSSSFKLPSFLYFLHSAFFFFLLQNLLSPQNSMSTSHINRLTQMLQNVFSDNSNIMLAAIISLLLVILFVLLLHLYAKWFLAHAQAQAQARRRRSSRRRPASVTVSDVIGPTRFHHFHSFNLQDSPIFDSPTKGLDSASIAAIPIFIYEAETVEEGDERELECVICLSVFEDGEAGRSLPKCGHAFHVECIDMWLSSHSNCPICRAPIVEHDSQLGSVHEDDSSAVLEIVISSPSSEVSENERGTDQSSTNNDNDNGGVSDSAISISSETSSSLLSSSLKRMLSKVFPSSNVNELNP